MRVQPTVAGAEGEHDVPNLFGCLGAVHKPSLVPVVLCDTPSQTLRLESCVVQIKNGLACTAGGSDRLLTQHVLPCLECFDDVLGLDVQWQADDDGPDILPGKDRSKAFLVRVGVTRTSFEGGCKGLGLFFGPAPHRLAAEHVCALPKQRGVCSRGKKTGAKQGHVERCSHRECRAPHSGRPS